MAVRRMLAAAFAISSVCDEMYLARDGREKSFRTAFAWKENKMIDKRVTNKSL